MKLLRNVLLSRKTLFSHKLRTFLGLIGITVGIASVVLMAAVGEGAQKEVVGLIQEMGANLLVVSAERSRAFAGREFEPGNVETLTREDAAAIRDGCWSVARVAPAQQQRLLVKREAYAIQTKILGTTADYPIIRNFDLAEGEFFSDEDDRLSSRVAVIGNSVRENLFGVDYSLGETIRIANIPFEVVGVLRSKGLTAEGSNEDDQIIIPLRTALRRVFNQSHLRNIYVRAWSRDMMRQAETEIRDLLRDRHRLEAHGLPDDFSIQNQITALEAEEATTESFTFLIAGIAAISLVVGGVGILAVMLMAVRERTGEIGLRMAVGARKRDILAQFLSEALILGMAGGLLGVVIGVGGAMVVGEATRWHTVVPWQFVGIAFVFSLSVGLFFGVHPARSASLLLPIDALRSE